MPVKVRILDEAAAEVHNTPGQADIQPACCLGVEPVRRPAVRSTRGRRATLRRLTRGRATRQRPEFDPRRRLDLAGVLRTVKTEAAAGLPPLKPDGEHRERQGQHQEPHHKSRATRARRHGAMRRSTGGLTGRAVGRGCPGGRRRPGGFGHETEPLPTSEAESISNEYIISSHPAVALDTRHAERFRSLP